MIPERMRNTLIMFNGEEPNGEVELDEDESLWSMRLYPSNLWTGSNSINDVKRIIHKDRVHIIVVGNGGDGEHRHCIYCLLCCPLLLSCIYPLLLLNHITLLFFVLSCFHVRL